MISKAHNFNTCLFYKQHFYKKYEAEIDKKLSKSYATPRGRTFAIWKLFPFFIHVITQK